MPTSYDVKIWDLRENKSTRVDTKGRPRPSTFTVRWLVAGREFPKTFKTKGLADSFRSELIKAAKGGEAFDTETGLPVSVLRTANSVTWYAHMIEFMDMKWPRLAPNSRYSMAYSLAAATMPLTTSAGGRPKDSDLRAALIGWVLNPNTRKAKAGKVPAEFAAAVKWLAANTVPVDRLAKPSPLARTVLDSLAINFDGSKTAASSIARRKRAFHQALQYAVEKGRLPVNPLDGLSWYQEPTDDEVDPRVVVSPRQAVALIEAAGQVKNSRGPASQGRKLRAFFGLLFFAGTRPAEALMLHEWDLKLPESGWGEILLTESDPQTSTAWMDADEIGESRPLKHRSRKTTRPVPACPELVVMLREHIAEFPPGPDGRIFVAPRGGLIAKRTYCQVWSKAREAVLTPAQQATVLAGRPYDLRHACVSIWLNDGVSPTQVAVWAGHSVQVLLRTYAKCVQGQDAVARRRIEEGLRESLRDDPDSPGEQGQQADEE